MTPRIVDVRRYVTPLREGGSLPAIVEADDLGLYVLKFRGSGQGPKALIAEWIAGEIARALGLDVPEIVFATLDPELARTEADPEIQALIRASAGLNLALDYLPGSVTFDPVAWKPTADLASRIVWLDAYVTNVDRTAKNVNLLLWHGALRLIDHGAALYFHHDWAGAATRSQDAFERIRDHVLLPQASRIAEVDAELAAKLTPTVLRGIVDAIPAGWLEADGGIARRDDYFDYLQRRLTVPRRFVEEALRARTRLL
ncbi:MAG: HipA family kinase [Steroidobacteraceae bacterium]